MKSAVGRRPSEKSVQGRVAGRSRRFLEPVAASSAAQCLQDELAAEFSHAAASALCRLWQQ